MNMKFIVALASFALSGLTAFAGTSDVPISIDFEVGKITPASATAFAATVKIHNKSRRAINIAFNSEFLPGVEFSIDQSILKLSERPWSPSIEEPWRSIAAESDASFDIDLGQFLHPKAAGITRVGYTARILYYYDDEDRKLESFRKATIEGSFEINVNDELVKRFQKAPVFVLAADIVPVQKDIHLHVRVTYRGDDAIEVYRLFTSSVRVIWPGTWESIPTPERVVVTGTGSPATETLHKGEFLEADFPLATLFQSVKDGENHIAIEVAVKPVGIKPAILLRQQVSAHLSTQEAAMVKNPPAAPNPK
jgi:hypothetical protein